MSLLHLGQTLMDLRQRQKSVRSACSWPWLPSESLAWDRYLSKTLCEVTWARQRALRLLFGDVSESITRLGLHWILAKMRRVSDSPWQGCRAFCDATSDNDPGEQMAGLRNTRADRGAAPFPTFGVLALSRLLPARSQAPCSQQPPV